MVGSAAAVGLGAYLKFATRPVRVAFGLGRDCEHMMADPARYVPAFTTGYRIGRRDRQAA
jgi:hypothetical protein